MNRLEPLLEATRGWLSQQVEFRGGWTQGAHWLEDAIDRCVHAYLPEFVSGPPAEVVVEVCRVHLCECLLYHWSCAWERGLRRTGPSAPPLSGAWVMDTLQAGRRPTTPSEADLDPKSLGGNPLRDLILAENAVRRSDRALECLYREYRGTFESVSRRVFGHDTSVMEWEDLVSRLVVSPGGPDSADVPLSQYRGYSSLRSWLRTVCRNFLMDVWRGSRSRRTAERYFAEARGQLASEAQGRLHEPEGGEELAVIRSIVLEALARLDARDRAILIWAYQCDLPNSTIAESLGVSQGHASRLREKSLLRLLRFLRPAVLECSAGQPSEGWQSRILELSPPSLGHLLRAVGAVPEQEETSPRSVNSMADRVTNTPAVTRRTSMVDPSRGPELVTSLLPVGVAPLSREAFFNVPLDGLPQHAAEAIAEDLLKRAAEDRPAVVCLDARLVPEPRVVSAWLDRFDAALSDEDGPEPAEAVEFYEPRRLVMASEAVVGYLRPDYLRYGDVTWLPDAGRDEPYELYTRFLQQSFAKAFAPPPARPVPAMSGRSVEDSLTEGERGEWQELVGQLERWGRDPDVVS